MSYKIIDQYEEKTIKTVVQYDSIDEPVTISHFMPKDQEEIIKGIENREISEKKDKEEKEKRDKEEVIEEVAVVEEIIKQ